MELAEIRKGVIAVLGAVVAVVPQVLSSPMAGVIPASVAAYLTIVASVATAVLVYLVPNSTPAQKVQASIDALGPVAEAIRQRVSDEIAARLPQRVQTHVIEPEVRPDPSRSADPFVIPRLGG